MIPGIYAIDCLPNMTCYIGQASDIPQRWHEHLSGLRRGVHANARLQNCWNKYGEKAFEFSVVELCGRQYLTMCEQRHMLSMPAKRLINIAPNAGSRLGIGLSPAACAKISVAHAGGLSHSKEQNEKRSATLGTPITLSDGRTFRSRRHLIASLGLTTLSNKVDAAHRRGNAYLELFLRDVGAL